MRHQVFFMRHRVFLMRHRVFFFFVDFIINFDTPHEKYHQR